MEQPFEAPGIRGILHRPDHPRAGAILLTHGAGSDSQAPLLVSLARGFADAGFLVLRYDLPYRLEGRKSPPLPAAQGRDREGIVRAVEALRGIVPGGRIVAGGHSYGGRQTAMAAAEHPGMADSLLLLSYPLHPPDKPQQLRTSFFGDWRTPALFVHGSRDPFGTIEELQAALGLIPAKTDLMTVPGAGHDLKKAGAMAEAILARMLF
jgi:predicted alpha/beta-hydrolase family hydrolase